MTYLPPLDMHCHPVQAREYLTKYPATDADSFHSVAMDTPSLLAMTYSPDEWTGHALASAQGHAQPVWALGLHPWEPGSPDQLASFFSLVSKCDAIGEVGLDASAWATSSLNIQRENLTAILDSEQTRDRIVSLHGFEAYADLIGVLEDHLCAGAVLHWFLCSPQTLERAVALDVFYSVNHAMFSVPEGPAIVAAMPRTRVLLETDAPYIDRATGRALSPDDDQSVDRPLWPGEVGSTEAHLAGLWRVEVAEVRRQVWRNLAELESRVQRRPFAADATLRRHGTAGAPGAREP